MGARCALGHFGVRAPHEGRGRNAPVPFEMNYMTGERIMNRLLALMALVVLICAAAAAHDGTARQDKGPFTLKKLTQDIYALYGRGGNIGFAVTAEGVVVIDDQFEDLATGIVEQIRSVTQQPIKFLINTHHHGDHTGGNSHFIKIATIIAHENVRKHMLAQPQEIMANAPRQIESLQERIAKLEKENPQSGELVALRRQMEDFKQSLERARQLKVTDIPAPNLTFDREVKLYLGGKEIHIFHIKRGHTDGDSIIYFPQDKVVHMGDLFFNKVIPFIDRDHGASTQEWIETIDAVLSRIDPASQVIPGHGQVTSVEELRAFKEYFLDLRAAVKKAIQEGKTREQAAREVKLEKYAQYAGYAQRFQQNVLVVYDELTKGG
jgi:glyoxylase-like metal-dependent hydrolase (beta-lactamase superfamily II)